MSKSKYVDRETLSELFKARDRIIRERNRIMDCSGIDILDNDTISSLSLWEIVSQYDSDFTINFSRNGEDGQSNGIITEHKCCKNYPRKDGSIRLGSFQFHAMGELEYPRFIFAACCKKTLEFRRLYDIAQYENVQKIVDCLMKQRKQWLSRGQKDHTKMKRDVITIKEQFLQSFDLDLINTMSNCEVYRG